MKKILLAFILILCLSLVLMSCFKVVDQPEDDKPASSEKSENDNTDDEPIMPPPPLEYPEDSDKSDDEEVKEPELPEPETSGEPDENGMIHVTDIRLDRYSTELEVGQIDMPWTTFYPYNATDKGEKWSTSDSKTADVDKYGRITAYSAGECTVTVRSSSDPGVTAEIKVKVVPSSAPKEPTYIDGIMIANKSYALPATYNPGVDSEAAAALENMIKAAAEEGMELFEVSGFRSYETQQNLYSKYLLREGRDAADRYSARPGYSEHQTGLAFDLNSVEESFGDTAEGKWLAANCAEYGFIIRYPKGKEEVTGYMYEPWHVRYLGVEKAKAVYESGLTLEEYLGITSVYPN